MKTISFEKNNEDRQNPPRCNQELSTSDIFAREQSRFPYNEHTINQILALGNCE